MNSEFYSILVHLHSIGRWLLLVALLTTIFRSLTARNREFEKSDQRMGILLVIILDLVVLAGLILWYLGPLRQLKGIGIEDTMANSIARFFVLEHPFAMLVALILIHLGKRQSRKQIPDSAKHRRTAAFYLIGLLIILISIPWPFLDNGTNGHWY